MFPFHNVGFRLTSFGVIASLAILCRPPTAAAQSLTWVGTVNGSWSNANNWSPAVVPPSGISTQLQFYTASTAAMNNDIAGTFVLNKMNIPAGATGFSLIGNPLDFRTNPSSVLPTIVMGSANVFTIGNGLTPMTVTLTNNLTVSGTGTGELALFCAIGGVGGLTYSGAGTLFLDPSAGAGVPNTYAGGTAINSGTLLAANPFSIPSGGSVTIASGATMDVQSNNGVGAAISPIGTLTLNGTFRAPNHGNLNDDYWLNRLVMTNGTLDLTGSSGMRLHFTNAGAGITLNGTNTWTNAGTSAIVNETASPLPITNNGGILDAGAIFFGFGANPNFTFTGSIRLSNTRNSGNLTFGNNAVLYTNDLSTNVGSGAFGTLGTGTITLSNSTLRYDGPTATSAKPLSLTTSAQIIVVNPGVNLTMTGVISQSAPGATLSYGNSSAPTPNTLTLNATNTYSGSTTVSDNCILAVPNILNGGLSSPIGASTNAPSNLQLGSSNYRGTLLLNGANATYHTDRGATVTGYYTGGAGGAIGVQNAATTLTMSGQITGAGTLVLSNPTNSHTGGTYVEAGTLTLGSATAIPAGGSVNVSNGAVFDIATFVNSQATAPGTVTLSGGTLRAATNTNYYLNKVVTDPAGGTIDANGSTSFGSLQFTNAGAAITVNGNSTWTGPSSFVIANYSGTEMPINIAPNVIVTSGIGLASDISLAINPIRVTGGGTLYLTSPAQFRVAVRVSQARLRMDDLTNVTPGYFDLTLDAGTLQYGGPTATADLFTVGTGGGTLEVLSAATTLKLAGAFQAGIGGLTKAGPGTLTLANAGNLFNGLTINAGVVQTDDDNTLGTGPIAINGGALRYTAGTSTSRTFYLNSGAIESASGATLMFSGATFDGGFLRGAGVFALMGNTVVNGATTYNSATVNQTGPATLNNFTNSGTLTNAPTTTLTWNGGVNTSSGNVTVNGSMNVSDWSSNGVVTINGGGALNNNGSNLVLGGGSRTTINPSGMLATATGTTIELNGGLLVNNGTITGTTDVNYGSLAKGTGLYGVVNVNQGGVYAPGNSPGISTAAAVIFDHASVSSGAPVLQIELAGTAPGTQYDQLHVTGQLALGGRLQVSLLNAFAPAAGNTFDILEWGTLSGTFAALHLPTLTDSLSWNTSQLYTSGVLSVANASIPPGDFNRDGHVNAADLPAMLAALTDLNRYKSANSLTDADLLAIGDIDGSGSVTNADVQALLTLLKSGGGSVAAVPEPASIVLLALALPGLAFAIISRRGSELRFGRKRCK